jgi:hypothetical protein
MIGLKNILKFYIFIYFSFTLIEYGTIINNGFKWKHPKNDISAINYFLWEKNDCPFLHEWTCQLYICY